MTVVCGCKRQAIESGEQDLSGFGNDFYPYVYLTLTIGDN